HRLLAPRHPPCALSLLIVKNTLYAAMEFSRCTPVPQNVRPNERSRSTAGLSKLSSNDQRRGRRVLGELVTGRIHHGRAAHRSNSAPDSLERRGSSRSFRYGYLVTTSPQSPIPPSTAPTIAG